MRKLIMAVAVLGMSATMNFAKAQCVNEYGNKEPFAVEFSRLSSYLGLAPYQMEEVQSSCLKLLFSKNQISPQK